MISVWVAGIPKGQPRGRAFSRGGKPRIYTPGTAEAWKGQIALAFRDIDFGAPIEEASSISIDLFLPRPKRLKKAPAGPLPHDTTPDWDNCAKAVCDALVEIGVFQDDKWISHGTLNKWHTSQGGRTGALIRISRSRGWAGPERGPWEGSEPGESREWPALERGNDADVR